VSWPLVQFKDVAQVVTGSTPKKIDGNYDGNIPFVTPGDLGKYAVISSAKVTVSEQGAKSGRLLPKNTVMVCCIGATIGKVGISNKAVISNQQINSLIFDELKVIPKYAYYFCTTIKPLLITRSSSTTMPIVNKSNFSEFTIPLPPLDEQKRIAAILDKADAIRRKRQQAIQLADDFLRSVFLDMFGDPVTNPKGWEVRKLADIGTLDRGKSKHRPRNDPALLGGTHPLIQTGDVAKSKGYIKNFKSTYSELGLQQSRKWPAGTLCITIAANIAKTGILTFDACFPDSVVGFNPNKKATTEYVQIWIGFLQKILEASAPESAQKNINLAILRDLDVPIPPIALQQKYSEIVGSIVSTNEKYDTSIDVKEDFFNSISQKAFAGQL
jgi:type I restriction enzyme S subunit